MLLTTGRGRNSFINDLKRNYSQAENVWIITAYVSMNGLFEIMPMIQNCKETIIIVGDSENPSCREVEEILYKNKTIEFKKSSDFDIPILKQLIKKGQLKIIFAKNQDVKIIHSKGYLLKLKNNTYISYVGSSNLTYPGFYMNKEWMIKSIDYKTVNEIYMDYMFELNKIMGKNNYVKALPLFNIEKENLVMPYTEEKKKGFMEKLKNLFT